MRRFPLVFSALLSVGLVACGSNDPAENSNAITITPAEPTTSAESFADGAETPAFNTPFEISTLAGNDVFLTINDITLGEDCRFGSFVPGYRNDQLGDDMQYLQVLAEVGVAKLENPLSNGMVYLNDIKAVDSEGFTQTAALGIDCQPGEGYESWSLPTEPGDKSRRYGAFIVPKGITEVRIEGKTFPVDQGKPTV